MLLHALWHADTRTKNKLANALASEVQIAGGAKTGSAIIRLAFPASKSVVGVNDAGPILACPCHEAQACLVLLVVEWKRQQQNNEKTASHKRLLLRSVPRQNRVPVHTNGCQESGPSASTHARSAASSGKKRSNRSHATKDTWQRLAKLAWPKAPSYTPHAAAVQRLPKGCVVVGDRCDHLSNPLKARADERVHTRRIKICGNTLHGPLRGTGTSN